MQGYGPQGAWPAGVPQTTSTRAVIALVAAIASFVVLPLIPAIVALVLAPQATREIETSGGRIGGAGLVTGAKVVAWTNVVLSVLFLLALVALVAGSTTSSV